MAMIPVTVMGVEIERATGAPVVLLRENDAPHRILPIFVGPAEARAISVALAGLVPPRPGTHDLLASTLRSVGTSLQEVEVTELRDGTFLAELVLDRDGGELRVSSRPSDAVALAIRLDAPVFAADAVLEEAGVLETPPDDDVELSQEDIDETVAQLEDFLASIEPGSEETDPGDN